MQFPPANLIELQKTLSGYNHPWWVAGGWGIDLHLGFQSRDHADLEIAIPYEDQQNIRKYIGEQADWHMIENRQLIPWPPGKMLAPPIHEIHCKVVNGPHLEILLNIFTDTEWIYRRNHRIRLPRHQFLNGSLIPLPREVLLLYKSKQTRPKDEADFTALIETMALNEQAWMKSALMLSDGNHPWIDRLKTISP
jgi:hypothetical protein